jgi:hypothetical protein
MATIEELLKSMLTLPTEGKKGDFVGLENTKATWERIANKDSFAELNFSSESEKEKFLSDWCAENEYTNI